jgi:tellurite resistance protein
MDAMPVDLLKQIHPVYGGAIGFGVWFGFQLFRAWREFTRERREAKAAETIHEAQREGRKSTAFATIDKTRDDIITALSAQMQAAGAAVAEESRRHLAELERLDKRLAATTRALERVEADRDRGWDLTRELNDRLHDMRHEANNKLQAAYIVGKAHGAGDTSAALPTALPPIPPIEQMAGKRPD